MENGYAKVSYNYSLKQSTYKKSGKVKSTTYPVKSSGLTDTAVTSTNDIDSLDAGDIIAYSKGGRATHVAVYIGRFDSKSDLVEYLNTEVGIKCSKNTSWIKSWNGNCKHWVIQGGMGMVIRFIFATTLTLLQPVAEQAQFLIQFHC